MQTLINIGFTFSAITVLLYIYQVNKRTLPKMILYIPSVVMGMIGVYFTLVHFEVFAERSYYCADVTSDLCNDFLITGMYWDWFLYLAIFSSIFAYIINKYFVFKG